MNVILGQSKALWESLGMRKMISKEATSILRGGKPFNRFIALICMAVTQQASIKE